MDTSSALAPAVFVPVSRDRATMIAAAVAVAALAVLPWSTGGWSSALMLAFGGSGALQTLLAGTLALAP